MKRRLTIAVSGAAALVGGLIPPVGPAVAATTITVESSGTIKAGVTFRRFLIKPGPVRLNVVTVDLAKASTSGSPSTIDVSPGSRSTLGGQFKTSAIGIATKALVATNGDFGGTLSTRFPEHPFIVNGEVWTSGTDPANNVGVTVPAPYATNVPHGYARRTNLQISAASKYGLLDVGSWNARQPSGGVVVGFSSRGGSARAPKAANCNVRLAGPAALATQWAKGRAGVVDTYTVASRAVCGASSYARPTGRDVVLSAVNGTAGGTAVKAYRVGDEVRIRWTIGFPRVLDSLGGRPTLIARGASAGTGTGGAFVCPNTANNLCKAQPRSVVSMTKQCSDGVTGCKVSLIVVDGRSSTWSVGITLNALVSFLKSQLAAYSAVNLDGGGTATMYIRKTDPAWCQSSLATGCLASSLKNNNGSERATTNAMVLLPGIDPKEPTPKL
jgi:hypothetical protein